MLPARRALPLLLALPLALLVPGSSRAERPVEAGSRAARRPTASDSVGARPLAPVPAFPTYHAPGGGIFVPRELVTLSLLPDQEEEPEPGGDEPRRLAPPEAGTVGNNVRLNDTTNDPTRTCNAETSIAALGRFLVAGWNDGLVFPDPPGASGYAYSTDAGATWTDGGLLPAEDPAFYAGDPVITVDSAGNFYYSSLYLPDGQKSNLAVNRGRFEGDSLVWGPPVTPVFSTPADFLDKEWIACDPANGIVYLAWTRFTAGGGGVIEVSRSLDHGATWSPRRALTSSIIQGVQGARIVIGPNHEVFVMYFVYDYATRLSFMGMRRSLDLGATWSPQVLLPAGPSGLVTPYSSGPPGFNRSRGIGLPSLAIDRSTGPRRGHLYAVWEETVDYLSDPLGTLGETPEMEPNGSADSALVITIGATATGNLEHPLDQDWYRFSGAAGQTVILYLLPAATNPGAGDLRLFCAAGGTDDRVGFSDLGLGYALIVYTLPRTGDYFAAVRVSNGLGNYRLETGWHSPNANDLARDTRDVILQSSADGVAWDAPRRISVEAPGSDDAFPEVAVDGDGALWIDWYAHRVEECRILCDVYYTRSLDGGATFAADAKANDGPPVNWNRVPSNLAPNMGDYMTLIADGCRVYANFTDGREGTPDSWLALLAECSTPVAFAWRGARSSPSGLHIAWQVEGGSVAAIVERRAASASWQAIGRAASDARGILEFVDGGASPGARIAYRLTSESRPGEALTGEVWVDVPRVAPLAVRVQPASAGAIAIEFDLPSDAGARLDVFDVAGRRVRSTEVSPNGAAPHRAVLENFSAGLYWVRLTQAAGQASARAVVLR